MQKETVMTLIRWTKRALGLIAFLLWGYVIFTISNSPAPFMEQVPYCMVSTMLIFGVLTGVYKGLDHWSLQQKDH
jgi:peptidoglycan/LPS O-acetylase OafA/YrhL